MSTNASRSRAFFLELILDIAVFALCAAIALQVFVEAHLISERSTVISHMNIEMQTVAEKFKTYGNSADFDVSLGVNRAGDTLTCYYNSEYVQTVNPDSPYVIKVSLNVLSGTDESVTNSPETAATEANTIKVDSLETTSVNALASAHVSAFANGTEILSLDVSQYSRNNDDNGSNYSNGSYGNSSNNSYQNDALADNSNAKEAESIGL